MLRAVAESLSADVCDPHQDVGSASLAPTSQVSVASHLIGKGITNRKTSFYVDCGIFGGGGVANKGDINESSKREALELKYSQFMELSGHTEDQRIADPYYKEKLTPTLDSALIECLKTKKCIAFCRSENGSTVFHDGGKTGKLKMGFGDVFHRPDELPDYNEKGPWTCLARLGHAPEDAVGSDHIQDCWSDMFDATQGVWDDKKVPTISVTGKDGKKVRLLLEDSPTNPEDLEETKMRCEQEDECEAICVHEKDPWRAMLYGHFEKAKCALDPEACKAKKEAEAGVKIKPKKPMLPAFLKKKTAEKIDDKVQESVQTKARGPNIKQPTPTVQYAAPIKPVQRAMDRRVLPSATVVGSFLGGSKASFMNELESTDGLICPTQAKAEAEAKKLDVEVTHGQCVVCDGSNIADAEMMTSKDDEFHDLKNVFFLPDENSDLIAKFHCKKGVGPANFPCSCVDDRPEPHRWKDEKDNDPGMPSLGMLKECSRNCREAALRTAKQKMPEEYEAMTIDDAVKIGYQMLQPKGLEDEAEDKMNRDFWTQVLVPAKDAESWLKVMYTPKKDPALSTLHAGSAPARRAFESPYGEDVEPAEKAGAMPEPPPANSGWQCFYLSHKCRQQMKHKTLDEMKAQEQKYIMQAEDHKAFEEALQRTPKHQFQGMGTVASADYWAQSSAPVYEKTDEKWFVQKVMGTKAATLANSHMDRRMKDWYKQCKNLPELMPIATNNIVRWDDAIFRAELKIPGNKTYIKEPSGRWLECAGGLTPSKKSESIPPASPYAPPSNLSAKHASMALRHRGIFLQIGQRTGFLFDWLFGRSKSGKLPGNIPGKDGMIDESAELQSRFRCRELHEEPLANCQSCPPFMPNSKSLTDEPDHYRCLGKGWNGIPSGEFAPIRSLLQPVSPPEMPNEQEPGESGYLRAARMKANPEEIVKRQPKKGIFRRLNPFAKSQPDQASQDSELRCIDVGRAGETKTNSANRVIFTASEMPPILCAVAALSANSRQSLEMRTIDRTRGRKLNHFL